PRCQAGRPGVVDAWLQALVGASPAAIALRGGGRGGASSERAWLGDGAHVRLRPEADQHGNDGARHAGYDQRVADFGRTAFLAQETRKEHSHVANSAETGYRGKSTIAALRYRCAVC